MTLKGRWKIAVLKCGIVLGNKKGDFFMNVHTYPLMVSIYKGEGRILIIPYIDHIAGYSVYADWFVNLKNIKDYTGIGEAVRNAVDFIRKSPLCVANPMEYDFEKPRKKNTKYKSEISFWKNNLLTRIKVFEDGHYLIYSMKRSEKRKGGYSEIIKEINLLPNASNEEIGKTVLSAFEALEDYYKNNKEQQDYLTKNIELLGGSMLTLTVPKDNHFIDSEDCHAAEIYQCYSYFAQEGAESSAEFFLGIAPELDCNLDALNVRSSWEEFYGKTDFFEMQDGDYGIFKLRIEMKNKHTHKISYLLRQDEDLLLECGMVVHQPNRRKKLDENLIELFKEFVLSCKM